MPYDALNLSRAQIDDFVNTNPEIFGDLIREAEELNARLPEDFRLETWETQRGPMHRALALNGSLGDAPSDAVIDQVIQLINNSLLRVITFFDEYIKLHPEAIENDFDDKAEVSVLKSVSHDYACYGIKFNPGPMFDVFCSL